MIVERLVLHLPLTQCIEAAMHISNRLNAHGGEDFDESERQSVGRDLAHTLAKPRALAQGIEHLLREDRVLPVGVLDTLENSS